MLETHDFRTARHIADDANDKLAALGIPASPQNYAVWYTYCAGDHPDLTAAVDAALSKDEPFTSQRNEALYDRFFGTQGENRVVTETGEGLQKEVKDILEHIGAASADSGTVGKKLQGYAEALAKEKENGGMAGVVREILFATREVAKQSHVLEQRLRISARQVARLQDRLESAQRENLTDGLTGIANRKCFERRLSDEASRAQREGNALSLLIAEIDFFKKFNDAYGNTVGDSALKVVAHNLCQSVRDQDLPARFGGDEFCVLLPDAELDQARDLAQDIRAQLTRKELKNTKTGDSYGKVTLSIGVAQLRPGEALSHLVRRADRALFMAKSSGRDRVACESEFF